jgi:molybdate transport system substrate-binding protein
MKQAAIRRIAFRPAAVVAALAVALAACSGSVATSAPSGAGPSGAASASGIPSDAGSPAGSAGSAGSPTQLTVLAASSLTEAFADLADAYRTAHPDVSFALSFDASSALRARIEAGGTADVFASADTANPATLASAGLTLGSPVLFAANELALVVPAANPARISTPYDLARPGVRIVAAGANVPISTYVVRLIANLQAFRGAQAGLPAAIDANTVSREDNVKAVLAKVELGEADAGFVYATDARGDAKVRTIELPPGTNVVASYAAAALSSSGHPVAADAFVA